MRSVTYRTEDLQRAKLTLGFVGENLHTRFIFDCRKDFGDYPSAAPALTVQPPEGEPYPAVITRDGDLVYWDVKDSDLINQGDGEIQLAFVQGEVIKRTYIGKTSVLRSIIPTGEIPDPLADFLVEAGAALTAIPQTIADALAEAKASGEFDGEDGVGIQSIEKTGTSGLVDTYTITLTDGRSYTYTVTNGADGDDGVGVQSIAKTSTSGLVDTYTITYTNGQATTFTVTNGAPGDDGYSPSASVSKSGKITTVTITDKSGTTTAEIHDGEDRSAFVVHVTTDSGGNPILDKTWQEINTASIDTPVILTEESGNSSVFYCDELYVDSHTYYVTFKSAYTLLVFSASDPSGYPALGQDRIEFPPIDDEAGTGDTGVTFSADKLTRMNSSVLSALNKKQEKPETTGQAGQVLGLALVDGQLVPVWITPASGGDVTDVQIDGTSILDAQGVANVPVASDNVFGVIKIMASNGIAIDGNKRAYIFNATSAIIKTGTNTTRPITPSCQHESVFFALSKLAGEDLKNDTVTVGQYPEKSKSAISQMLNGAVQVTGTTPVIVAKPGIPYICGECATVDITVPSSGIVDVVFESGSTPTVLTVTPPTGITAVKWANGFNPTALEANTVYEINIMNGVYGVVASWT